MTVAILISSCEKYYQQTVPILLESMDVPREHIHIVVGECTDESDDTFMDCQIHFRRWANFDNNALIWAAEASELYRYTWVFNLHDTCECEPGFWNNIQPVPEYEMYDAVKLVSHDYSMCIGLYRTTFLRRVNTLIHALKSYVPGSLHVKSITEDSIFNMSKNLTAMSGPRINIYDCLNRYGTTTARMCEHFPVIGLKKYKANCGSIHCTSL
jgi:hypothetical protein